MKKVVFGTKVKGESHVRSGSECQDSFGIYTLKDESFLIAVADGHGSPSSPYSRDGSKRAVQSFFKVLKPLYDSFADQQEHFMTYLNREGGTQVAHSICAEWRSKISACHTAYARPYPILQNEIIDKSKLMKLYGTTLLGLLYTPYFIFAFQIGDGEIGYVDAKGYTALVESEKMLGVETHSLASDDSWKNAVTSVHRVIELIDVPSAIVMNTDGFSNSYRTDEEYKNACSEYLVAINQYGPGIIRSNLRAWLKETSQQGSGDDVTMVIAYYYS